MKTGTLVGLIYALSASLAWAQGAAEMPLYESLTQGPGAGQAVETVLARAANYSPVVLYTAAGAALRQKRLEDSAFLFYAGQLRARFDKECFPPRGTGANNPLVAINTLGQDVGASVNPAVMANPKAFAKVYGRLKEWQPLASAEYDPGYEYAERKSATEAEAAVLAQRNDYLARMADLSALLNDGEYFDAFRTMQAYNLGQGPRVPSDAENERAIEAMIRIEKAKGLRGVFSE